MDVERTLGLPLFLHIIPGSLSVRVLYFLFPVLVFFFFQTGSHFSAQAGLEIEMFVHQPSTSWRSRCEPSSSALLALLTVVFTRADEKSTRSS